MSEITDNQQGNISTDKVLFIHIGFCFDQQFHYFGMTSTRGHFQSSLSNSKLINNQKSTTETEEQLTTYHNKTQTYIKIKTREYCTDNVLFIDFGSSFDQEFNNMGMSVRWSIHQSIVSELISWQLQWQRIQYAQYHGIDENKWSTQTQNTHNIPNLILPHWLLLWSTIQLLLQNHDSQQKSRKHTDKVQNQGGRKQEKWGFASHQGVIFDKNVWIRKVKVKNLKPFLC